MHLEIISPERTLYSGEATSVIVPGADGEFQILDHHAPIVSILEEGTVKIKGVAMAEKMKQYFKPGKEANEMLLEIPSGTVEVNDNKVIVLAD